MDWRKRNYYLVDFDADFHNQQVHECKKIYSSKVFSNFRGYKHSCVSVSKENGKKMEEILEEFKLTSETKFERFWKERYID